MKIGRLEIRNDYPLSLREWAELIMLIALIAFVVAILRSLVG